jgi:neutral amino acid transport system substrate-binding protein
MKNPRLRRFGALVAGASLILAACGGDDDAASETTAAEETATTAATDDTTAPVEASCGLVVGTILPVTGDLAFLGPPEIAGAELAVEDINAAGGVNGEPVVIYQGDSGDTTTDTANLEVDRLLALGVDVIVGAASSAVSKTVIDKITGAGVIQFSPANTSPDFTTYNDGGLYFRTAPSDLLQGRVLANLVLDDGAETASVIFRQESYGTGLAEAFQDNFESLGGTVAAFLPYAVDTQNFDAEVDQLVDAAADAIVVIGFDESAAIITTMHERGIGPTDVPTYGVDGNMGGLGELLADPSILTGMKGTEPSVDLTTITEFTDRIKAYPGFTGTTLAYGAETYDAVMITALAAVVASQSNDCPTAVEIAAEINDVTRPPGTECTSFEECKTLIEAGEDIDFTGIGGPYDFVDAGEPAAASFRISQYDGDSSVNDELDVYVFAS